MTEIFEASWRVYPAAAMVAAGLVFAVASVRRSMDRAADRPDPSRVLELIQGFRFCVIGLSVAGLGVAWMWSIVWMAVLAAIIGGEELLESSFVIAAIRNGPENRKLTRSTHPLRA